LGFCIVSGPILCWYASSIQRLDIGISIAFVLYQIFYIDFDNIIQQILSYVEAAERSTQEKTMVSVRHHEDLSSRDSRHAPANSRFCACVGFGTKRPIDNVH
jgi:hypothetical protein